jgi:hypothetical protein
LQGLQYSHSKGKVLRSKPGRPRSKGKREKRKKESKEKKKETGIRKYRKKP